MRHTRTIPKRIVNHFFFFGIIALFCFTSCQIYQSPDRRDFENDRPVFVVQNYRIQSCGPESVRDFSQKSEIVYADESIRVTEFTVGTSTIYESENQQGDYCVLVQ